MHYIQILMPYCFSLDERKEELMHMNIALDGMAGGASALEVAATALSESEAVYERVLQLTTRITVELRTKVKELQSFSPDELGNIPRKRKFLQFLTLEMPAGSVYNAWQPLCKHF